MYSYQHMSAPQAEHPKSMYKLHPLLTALLGCSNRGQIKYKFLKQTCVTLQQTFGPDLFGGHHSSKDASLLPGKVADCLTVLLNHWRRVTSTESSFKKFCKRLDDGQAQVMGRLRPGQQDAAGCNELAKRVLKQNYSDITEDSMGLPAMASNFVTPEKKMNSMSSPSGPEVSLHADGLPKLPAAGSGSLDAAAAVASPPPAKKDDWKGAMKKPSSVIKPAKAADALHVQPEDVLIHQESLAIGGGKDQSYILEPAKGSLCLLLPRWPVLVPKTISV